VAHAFWAHDGSARGRSTTSYGNTWVVVALVVRLPFLTRPVALPVLAWCWLGYPELSRTTMATALVGLLAADFFISDQFSKQLWLLLALGPALLALARRKEADLAPSAA
jgi:hypothetical protein